LADNITKIDKYKNPDKLISDYYEGQTLGEIWGYETEGFFKDAADIASHAKQDPKCVLHLQAYGSRAILN
jgi:hypothetical protein